MADALPALLLTAGLGTRLDPLTRVRAKPAVPVAGVPLAVHIVRWLVAAGVRDITCNLHHLPHTLSAALGDGSEWNATIRYSWEQPQVLGSAGGPRQALDIVGADTFLLINGDTLTDMALAPFIADHADSSASVTLALVPNQEPERYGGVLMDAQGAVTGFAPRGARAVGSWHFIGVQAVRSKIFSGLPKGAPAATVGGVYNELIAREPGSVRGAVVHAQFMDIGTVADYRRTSKALCADRLDIGARVHIASTARVVDSIVWDDVMVAEGASLESCIVTDRVRVPEGAVYRHMILLNDRHGHLTAMPMPGIHGHD